ncbi:UNVERIFIED_CONTAM: hypothetical protein GTU68_056050 [Idotea baltica]|nr:hypothetical protein [Idotea baltica]
MQTRSTGPISMCDQAGNSPWWHVWTRAWTSSRFSASRMARPTSSVMLAASSPTTPFARCVSRSAFSEHARSSCCTTPIVGSTNSTRPGSKQICRLSLACGRPGRSKRSMTPTRTRPSRCVACSYHRS